MIEDMTVRNFGAHTQRDYIRSVKKLAAFMGRSPDSASAEVDEHRTDAKRRAAVVRPWLSPKITPRKHHPMSRIVIILDHQA